MAVDWLCKRLHYIVPKHDGWRSGAKSRRTESVDSALGNLMDYSRSCDLTQDRALFLAMSLEPLTTNHQSALTMNISIIELLHVLELLELFESFSYEPQRNQHLKISHARRAGKSH